MKKNIYKSFGFLALTLALGLLLLLAPPTQISVPNTDGIRIEPLIITLCIILILLFTMREKKAPVSINVQYQNTITASEFEQLKSYLHRKNTNRVTQKLAGRFPINIRLLPTKTGTSDEVAATFMTLNSNDLQHEIEQIFHRTNGRLLITGHPGSGKTTLLIQLALQLLEQGNNIPILLNLTTWKNKFRTLDEWARQILPSELSVSNAFAEKIYQDDRIVLLLDGLDEISLEHVNSCLLAINKHGENDIRRFVITSRIKEYEILEDLRNINFQVEVGPLTPEQIKTHLIVSAGINKAGGRAMLRAIEQDKLLFEAIETPFYLNITQMLFASGQTWSDFKFQSVNLLGRQNELLDKFVTQSLECSSKRVYSPENSMKWLKFLAKRMNAKELKSFELANIDEQWVSDKRLWYNTIWDFISIFVYGISWVLLFITIFSILAFIYCAIYLQPKGIQISEYRLAFNVLYGIILSLSKPLFQAGFTFGLIWWLIGNTMKKVFYRNKIAIYLLVDMRFGLGLFLFLGLLGGVIVWSELKWIGLFMSTIIFLLYYILVRTRALGFLSYHSFLILKYPYQRLVAGLKWFDWAIIEHVILRLLLFFKGSLPFNLVYFLNEMSRRHLWEFDGDLNTETGGGEWRWRHKILQDWFLNHP